jgi:hypothetical protein
LNGAAVVQVKQNICVSNKEMLILFRINRGKNNKFYGERQENKTISTAKFCPLQRVLGRNTVIK